ncbi:MAG: hypothetical protein MK209_10305, partial [Planctomycetes bacterium]|nr:hypothetical protein [Planctomycetota bacterium]
VKNAAGDDSVATSRAALDARTRRWAEAAGITTPKSGALEILSGLCYDKSDLIAQAPALRLTAGGHLITN